MAETGRATTVVSSQRGMQDDGANPSIDWIVFGDDWGVHPSTTQHLIKRLPDHDQIIWVDSIGMRAPRLTWADARRVNRRLANILKGSLAGQQATHDPSLPGAAFAVIRPRLLPWHANRTARSWNQRNFARELKQQCRKLSMRDPVVLAINPVAVAYLDVVNPSRVVYLRLDDYRLLPGVDAELIEYYEPRMLQRADVVAYTARSLMPREFSEKSHALPQGVDWAHFSRGLTTPSRMPVLGFFGLMAEWLDHRLIREVAERLPHWTLRFVGDQRFVHGSLRSQANIEFLPAIPYDQLPGLVADWSAAWIPFEVSDLTKSVNPLKLREYLSAGLPTTSTPLPEVQELAAITDIFVSPDADAIAHWLERTRATDTLEARKLRRDSMRGDGWELRAAELRRIAVGHPN